MKQTQPFWSLRSKIAPPTDKNNVPGPGTYEAILTTSHLQSSPNWKFGTLTRSNTQQKEFIGPTKYNPNVSTITNISAKLGSENQRPELYLKSQLIIPGPGAYQIKEDTKFSSYKFSMPKDPNRDQHIRNSSPNVSTYHPNIDLVKPKIKTWKIGTGARSSVIDKRSWVLPPGSHNQNRKKDHCLGIMGKDEKCKRFLNSSVDDIHSLGPGSHNPDNWHTSQQNTKGWTLAKRLNNPKKEHSPSPDIYNPHCKLTREKGPEHKMGTERRASMRYKNDSPGAKYLITDTSPNRSYAFGKEQRPIPGLVLGKQAKTGPADYDPKNVLSKKSHEMYSFSKDRKLKDPKEQGDSPPCSRYKLKGSFEDGLKYNFSKLEREDVTKFEKKKATPGPGSYNLNSSVDHGYHFSFPKCEKQRFKRLGQGADNFYHVRSSVPNPPHYMLQTSQNV